VTAYVIDTGDMFPLLEDVIGNEMLHRVKGAKIEMDDHCQST
jgi:hypothetical protein